MAAKPKFAHVVHQKGQPTAMRDWYCTVLDGHVVYENVAFDPEELLRRRRSGATAAELSTRSWCRDAGLPDPLAVLTGAS